MPNNVVQITGRIEDVKLDIINTRWKANLLTAEGMLVTASAWQGGRHPFLASGRAAEVIRERSRSCGEGMHCLVVANAKLISGKRSFLDIKHISFFEHGHLPPFLFTNVHLQGYLAADSTPTTYQLNGRAAPVLQALMSTDKPHNGGVHPVLLTGSPAETVAAALARAGLRQAVFQATLGGKLLTVRSAIHVSVQALTLIGPPLREVPVNAVFSDD